MSEDVTDKLARFTPVGLDRDAVLFAAGKAAGRSSPVLKWLTIGLLLSNAVTLTLLMWPHPRLEPHGEPEPSPPMVQPPFRSAATFSADDLPPLPAGGVELIPDSPALSVGWQSDPNSTLFRD